MNDDRIEADYEVETAQDPSGLGEVAEEIP